MRRSISVIYVENVSDLGTGYMDASFVVRRGTSGPSISLAGEWRLRLDPNDAGMREEWFKKADLFPDIIQLPGSTDEQHFGNKNDARDPGHLTRAYWFIGPVWYEREVSIPEEWKGKRVTLFLERCHWETQAWVDGYPLGLQNSLSTPQVYEVGQPRQAGVTPGRHRLTIRVDNRRGIDVGESSAVTEQGPGNWNGIAGSMELRATDAVWIDKVFIYPDLPRNLVHVRLRIRKARASRRRQNSRWRLVGPKVLLDINIGAILLKVIEQDFRLRARTSHGANSLPRCQELGRVDSFGFGTAGFFDEAHTTFGMRALGTAGRQMMLNGRVIHLRGTVDNGSFPLKGYPPTDVATWRARFQTYKDYGFNHVRFHSWCPPEAAFTAADELGLILQVENPMWIADGRDFCECSSHGVHPPRSRGHCRHVRQSSVLWLNDHGQRTRLRPWTCFCEPRAQPPDPRPAPSIYQHVGPGQFARRPDDYFVSAGPRWQNLRGDPRLEENPPDTDFDYQQYVDKLDRPVIAHELGQWTVFPNFAEARLYTGPLQPRYLDIYREALERNGLFDQAQAFRQASGALMVELYKEEIESNLRTPGLTGFQLLGLTDWPGFGPAFIGVLDTLGESKGLITPEAFRRFCSPTVPLLRLKKRTWTTNETLDAPVEIAHYGPTAIDSLKAAWILRDAAGRTLASGQLPPAKVPTGGLTALGEIRLELNNYPAPARYSIQVSAGAFVNDWDFWLYPEKLPTPPSGLVIATRWDAATRKPTGRWPHGGTAARSARAGAHHAHDIHHHLLGALVVSRPPRNHGHSLPAVASRPCGLPHATRTPTGNGGT